MSEATVEQDPSVLGRLSLEALIDSSSVPISPICVDGSTVGGADSIPSLSDGVETVKNEDPPDRKFEVAKNCLTVSSTRRPLAARPSSR